MSKSGIILAVLAVCLIAFIWVVSSATKKLTETPQTFIVGEQFIEHLSVGEYDQAMALAASDLQTDQSRAALENLVSQNTAVLNASTEVNLTGRGIDGDLRYAYGSVKAGENESPLYMEFIDENGETRVSYFSFNQEDIPDNNPQTNE